MWGTSVCYGLLGALGFLAYKDYQLHVVRGSEPISLNIPGVDLSAVGMGTGK